MKYQIIKDKNKIRFALQYLANDKEFKVPTILKSYLKENKTIDLDFLILATTNGNITGYALPAKSRYEKTIELNYLFVKDGFRKTPKRIGKNLFKEFCEQADQMNYKAISFISLNDAVKFYRRMGFKPLDKFNNFLCSTETALKKIKNSETIKHNTEKKKVDMSKINTHTAENLEEIFDIHPDIFSSEITKYTDNINHAIIALDEDIEEAGFLVAYKDYQDNNTIFLERINVNQDYKREKIGTTLIKELCEHALDEGFSRIILTSSPEGEPFYERLGFERESEYDSVFEGDIETIYANAKYLTHISRPKLLSNNKPKEIKLIRQCTK
ncbi:MAG: GNAT family N-acetyltransferase [Alphaproteobacteria bacterium]|jgi:predicted N-acetyltransferase YhbS|nr:GNAT family N-acetyltransferase [Alphaproteobacteria bacterium]